MNNLKPIAAILTVGFLLTGCVSVQQARANGPARTFTTTSTPEQVRDCLINESHQNVASPYKDGWLVTNSFAPYITQIAEIERVGEGTTVKVFTGAGAKMLIGYVENCVRQ